MFILPLIWLLSLSRVVTASVITVQSDIFQPSPTVGPRGEKAIVPTTSGQIGVNPVESDLGDAQKYIGVIYGTDTQYIMQTSLTTKWIGVNTEYLSISGTSTISIVIATATTAANNQDVGDISVILPEGLAAALTNSATTAVSACGSLKRKRQMPKWSRQESADALNCFINYAKSASADGGLIDANIALTAEEWAAIGFKVAETATGAIIDFLGTLTASQITKAILYLEVLAATARGLELLTLSGQSSTALSAFGKVNNPASGFGAKPPDKGCTGNENADTSSLLCAMAECVGSGSKCTLYPNENCPCLGAVESASDPQELSQSWLDYQQTWLYDVNNSIPESNPPGPCVPVGSKFDPQMLRILPLGGSITWGQQSPSGNGYRQYLRQQLIANGASVNMVGTIKHGTMGDNDNEGWPGFRVDQISDRANNDLPFLPNLVLINAGTNDIAQNYFLDTADQRLEALVDKLLDSIPGTVVIVSTLLVNRNSTKEALTQELNPKYISIVESMAAAGKLVYLADMSNITTEDINARDGTHPTDYGYEKMAGIWYNAIQEVYANCWLTPPAAVAGLDDSDTDGPNTKCDVGTQNTVQPIKIQKGSGFNDSNYYHFGKPLGQLVIPSLPYNSEEDSVDGVDDFVYINYNAGSMGVALNDGSGVCGISDYAEFLNTIDCDLANFQFGDLDGDGRADALCISATGDLSAWYNKDGGQDPREPNWVPSGHNPIKRGEGPRNRIRIADIDGDGRVDYLVIDDAGNVNGWSNKLSSSTLDGAPSLTFNAMGVISSGGTMGDIDGIQFADVNGDGRADWLWVSNSGEITTSINQRGSAVGAAPVWLTPKLTITGEGIGGGNVTNRTHIKLGRVFKQDPEPWITFPDYTGRGVDYTTVFHDSSAKGGPSYPSFLPVRLLVNLGGGGTRTKGDGVYYCDMRGSGSDDLVWVDKNGNLTLHSNNHMLRAWGQYKVIYQPDEDLMGGGHVRKDIHLADFDGDGKCDFLLVDKNTNSIHMIRNDYSRETDTFAWTDMGIVSGGTQCSATMGPALFDLSVRFADIDGDGKADFLCIFSDSVYGYLNRGLNSFQLIGLVKYYGVSAERVNIRFADVNGDGRADFLVLGETDGSVRAWTNAGSILGALSSVESISWTYQSTIFGGGYLRGECVYFANINGYGRADYIYVYPNNAAADIIYNICT